MERMCPVCQIPLKPIIVKRRLQLDLCHQCRGLWFDKDELTQMHAQGGQVPGKLLEIPAQLQARDKTPCQACGHLNDRERSTCERCGAPLAFLCPVCQIQLEQVQVGEVLIDRCQSCRGVWLDGGELALLFQEFARKKQAEAQKIQREGGAFSGDLATWFALNTVENLLIWRPDIVYHAGESVVDAVTEVPGLIADGVGAALEGVGQLPDLAGDVAEGAVDLASGAADMAGDVLGGAIDFAGDIPELAGAAAEAGASFIEFLFELLGSIFDN